MTVQLLLLITTIVGITTGLSHVRYLSGELDSAVSLRCEIAQLPSNAVITWVYQPKIPTGNGIKWLPLYANHRRLSQNNQHFILDHSGYDERTNRHVSTLTFDRLNLSDEGIYTCKSNQYQSLANIFNLTVTASLHIYPKDGIIELDDLQRSINLTCTLRELPTHKIDPLRLKWYHKQGDLHLPRLAHLIHSRSHPHQASLILSLHPHSPNDSGLFRCIYEHSQISKDVHVFYTSSVLGYSKSISPSPWSSSWLAGLLLLLQMLIFITR